MFDLCHGGGSWGLSLAASRWPERRQEAYRFNESTARRDLAGPFRPALSKQFATAVLRLCLPGTNRRPILTRFRCYDPRMTAGSRRGVAIDEGVCLCSTHCARSPDNPLQERRARASVDLALCNHRPRGGLIVRMPAPVATPEELKAGRASAFSRAAIWFGNAPHER